MNPTMERPTWSIRDLPVTCSSRWRTRPRFAPRRKRRQGRLNGLPAAPGFGRGRAHLLLPAVRFEAIDDRRTDDVAAERQRFRRAVAESVRELGVLKARLGNRLPEFDVAIVDAHAMMLDDQGFLGKVEAQIKTGLRAETALKHVVDEYLERFGAMRDEYLSERAADVKDVARGLLDFPSLHDGRVVFLCWMHGETEIGFWHAPESGFGGRQPLTGT